MKEFLRFIFNKRINLLKSDTEAISPHRAYHLFRFFSRREQAWFLIFAVIFVITAGVLLYRFNASFIVNVPADGGSFTEAEVGTPRFINPILATSDTDRDLVALVYSGLLRVDEHGNYIPDLAASYTISDDGKTYAFTLRQGLVWQDNKPITSHDIAFTIKLAQSDIVKSPKRSGLSGVSVETPDEQTVVFTLKQAYAPFLDNLTIGILPEHLWVGVDQNQIAFSTLNTAPIGSGPFRLTKISRDQAGIPTSATLERFNKFALGRPHLTEVVFRFFGSSDDALAVLRKGEVSSMSAIAPEAAAELQDSGRLQQDVLPRVFAIFFNQSNSHVLSNIEVRKALNVAVDKELIIKQVLSGFGAILEGPLPESSRGASPVISPELAELQSRVGADAPINSDDRVKFAREILTRNGWKYNEVSKIMEKKSGKTIEQLKFTIVTSNATELRRVAGLVAEMWDKIGAKVTTQFFEISDLNQNIIRPRKYDALLFGEIAGRFSDPFAFWHSSQRLDPGLNIALYANQTTDKLLEEARSTTVLEAETSRLAKFQTELLKDAPAVFLYAPKFLYLAPIGMSGVHIDEISLPSDRFLNINKWYLYTEKVWKIFAKNN